MSGSEDPPPPPLSGLLLVSCRESCPHHNSVSKLSNKRKDFSGPMGPEDTIRAVEVEGRFISRTEGPSLSAGARAEAMGQAWASGAWHSLHCSDLFFSRVPGLLFIERKAAAAPWQVGGAGRGPGRGPAPTARRRASGRRPGVGVRARCAPGSRGRLRKV